MMDREFISMGMLVPRNYAWGSSSILPSALTNSQKEPDQCLFPIDRRPTMTAFNGWPTLVLETGVSESLPRLQAEACWWFRNSSGATRIVIVITIRTQTREILVQKWQLAPADSPPLTEAYLDDLRRTTTIPPLNPQPVDTQDAFCSQEIGIKVTPQRVSVTGAPMLLQFEVLFDIPKQTDVQLDAAFFTTWASNLF